MGFIVKNYIQISQRNNTGSHTLQRNKTIQVELHITETMQVFGIQIIFAFHYYIIQYNFTCYIYLQYMTFYHKLTEGHIGITGWKLFYINKSTTKMVGYIYYYLSIPYSKFSCELSSMYMPVLFRVTLTI